MENKACNFWGLENTQRLLQLGSGQPFPGSVKEQRAKPEGCSLSAGCPKHGCGLVPVLAAVAALGSPRLHTLLLSVTETVPSRAGLKVGSAPAVLAAA